MANTVLQEDLWDRITELANQSKKTDAAVGYVSTGANTLLPLHQGDSLVVDMSLDCVRNGQTNPFEIRKFVNKGVNVYTLENLHAKVYVFDSECIVCSANVSNNSSDNLLEVGMLCDDQRAVSQARALIKSFCNEPVTPRYLDLCEKNYHPHEHIDRPNSGSNLWILGTWPVEYKDLEETLNEKEIAVAEEKLEDSKRFRVASLRWSDDCVFSKNVEVGDLVLKIWNKAEVYPPSRVIHLRRYKSFDGKNNPRILLYLEEPEESFLHPIKLHEFKKLASTSGLNRLGPYSCRQASKQEKKTILKIWR